MIRRIRISCLILLIGVITATGCAWDATNQKEEQTEQMSDANTDNLEEKEYIGEGKKKNTYEELANQMMEGDFSGMLETDRISAEDVQNVYKNMGDGTEWLWADINNDGINDLVWFEKEEGTGIGKPILGIFDINNQGKCVLWDTMDGGEYYFVTEKENLIYYSQYFGIYCYASYEKVDCDEEWNQVLEKGLYSYDIYDVDEVLFWFDEHDHTDMTQNGVYFKMYADGVEKTITKDEYKIEFEKLTQRKFEELFDLPDRSWLNDSDD